jgi:hypothetical protein
MTEKPGAVNRNITMKAEEISGKLKKVHDGGRRKYALSHRKRASEGRITATAPDG